MIDPDPREVQIFGTNNDTDKWAVIADNRFQLFDTEFDAEVVFNQLVEGGIDDSCFGAVEVVMPQSCSDELAFTGAVRGNLSHCIQVDLIQLKADREALARDVEAYNEGLAKDDDAFTFQELCEMGLATPSEENEKAYNINISKLQEWHDNLVEERNNLLP